MDWPAIGLYSAGSAVRPSSSVRLRRRWETYYRRSEAPRSTRLCPSHPSPLVCTASSTSMRPYRRTVRTESGPLPAGAVRQRGFELNRDPHRCVLPKAINRLRVIFIQFHRLPLFASPSHILSKDVCYCSGHAAVARTKTGLQPAGFWCAPATSGLWCLAKGPCNPGRPGHRRRRRRRRPRCRRRGRRRRPPSPPSLSVPRRRRRPREGIIPRRRHPARRHVAAARGPFGRWAPGCGMVDRHMGMTK